MRLISSILLALVLLAAWGCGPRQPPTVSEARGFCMSNKASLGEGCLDGNAVCDRYAQIMSGTYATARECREACGQAAISMSTSMSTMGCSYISNRGRGYCTQFCNLNHPE